MWVLRASLLLLGFLIVRPLFAQRTYATPSVLGTGSWYKIAVGQQGLIKLDLPFLNSLGISTANLGSSSIRVYGNGGGMLAENNAVARPDDLLENPLLIVDGGDGVLNGADYVCFYAPGPHQWVFDSMARRLTPRTNLYSHQSYYFLTIQGQATRMPTITISENPVQTVTAYDYKFYHELDTINFLKSGKEWYGEFFGRGPGSSLSRSFFIDGPTITNGTPVTIITNVAGRSVGAASGFEVKLNGQPVYNVPVPQVTGNFQEAFANANEVIGSVLVNATSGKLSVEYAFAPGAADAQGWLNRFEAHARAQLQFAGNAGFPFSDASSTGPNKVNRYSITNADEGTLVLDITDPLTPAVVSGTYSAGQFSFVQRAESNRYYYAVKSAGMITPQFVERVTNQNLHGSSPVDLLIVTPTSLMPEAERLANFHRQRSGLQVAVVSTTQVFNEFASGSPDPTAIRDFVKMYYDRAASAPGLRPKYLLLFGDASYDYKNRLAINTNLVPAYQSRNSLEPLNTYTSDDFFALLDDEDDINNITRLGMLDIAVGRIPASTLIQAKTVVDKIIHYHSTAALGPWRNQLTFVADDEDANLHLQDAELIAATAASTNPELNQYKIYLDGFRQESGSSGSRYPGVNQAIATQVYNGTLLWNYSGHGGSQRLAEEAVLDRDVVKQFNNQDKLPLFVTATCDFAPYDDPTIVSLGDDLLMGNNQGAVALTTTTRLVFAYSNRIINDNFIQVVLQRQPNGTYLPLGEALRQAKNLSLAFGDAINNRKFTLLGDPALTLALPANQVHITNINGSAMLGDTLKALEQYTMEGEVTSANGLRLADFNGFVYPLLFDKAQTLTTLANDAGSIPAVFTQQANVLYKGKADVVNGRFSFTFITPKDMSYQVATGQLSLYAENGLTDANGLFTNFKLGGTGSNSLSDVIGPNIRLYMNDEKFVDGGLVNQAPVLLALLDDSSGINTSGAGIGHDITLIIDGDERNTIVLNRFYQALPNSFQQGIIRFPMPELSPGLHTLTVKAWDVANNASVRSLKFVVVGDDQLKITNLTNYPNPFTTTTRFSFQHNQPPGNLQVQIQLYSVTGKLVHQIERIITTTGNRSTEIEWNGRDAKGAKMAKGVYVYRLVATATNGKTATSTQKLYLL